MKTIAVMIVGADLHVCPRWALLLAMIWAAAVGCPYTVRGQTNLHSINLSGWVVVTNSAASNGGGGGGTNNPGPGYYVDYVGGNDSLAGTNIVTAWQHCPGDPAFTGGATLTPGSTVYFKGGESYIITAPGNGGTAPGIALPWSGTNNAPITYNGSNGWGTGAATITDNFGTNGLCAFGSASPSQVPSNIVISGFIIGPIGGMNVATLTNYVAVFTTSGLTPSDTYTQQSALYNGWPWFKGATYHDCIAFETVSNAYLVESNSTPSGTNKVMYTDGDGADPLALNNGYSPGGGYLNYVNQPKNPGWGIYFNGSLTNVTIQNCVFAGCGLWTNSWPIGNSSLVGACIESDYGSSGLTISNCDINHASSGLELSYTFGSISNLTVASCQIHDYVRWGIDLNTGGGANTYLDYVFVKYNTFHDLGWVFTWYAPGTNISQATFFGVSGDAYHVDGIFDRVPGGPVYNGSNINFYGNTFYDTHSSVQITAPMYLSGAASANIYNNLFNISTYGSLDAFIDIQQNPNCNSNQAAVIRLINNTFVGNGKELQIGASTPGSWWNPDHAVQIYNNITYDFRTGFGDEFDFGPISNAIQMATAWSLNHDDYFYQLSAPIGMNYGEPAGAPWYGNFYTLGTASSTFGWEANGITNNPQFVALTYGVSTNDYLNNYGLATNSPAIGAGTPLATLQALSLPGLTLDITGKTRTNYNGGVDLGAYQH